MRSRDITRRRADTWLKTPPTMMSQCRPQSTKQKKVLLVLDIRTAAEYISSNSDGRWDERPGSGRSPQSEHTPSARRMVMSDSAMLAPPEDSDSPVGQKPAGHARGVNAAYRDSSWG